MLDKYFVWIITNVPGTGYGQCKDYSQAMLRAFPELRLVRGFFHCVWGARQHFWLVAPDGSVVDPTRRQFPGMGEYEELQDHELADRCPTGVCMDCGGQVFRFNRFCSPQCEAVTEKYLNGAEPAPLPPRPERPFTDGGV